MIQMLFLAMLNPQTRILVVDDSAIMRKIIIKYLEDLGFKNWVQAADGREALKMVTAGGVDIVLSDWNMPGLYGIDLLRAVRSGEKTSEIPFIMISAEAQPHQLAQALDEGVDCYITKPFTCKTLQRGLAQAFRSK